MTPIFTQHYNFFPSRIARLLILILCVASWSLAASKTALSSDLDTPRPPAPYLIKDVQIFETSVPGGAGAAFLTIENHSDQDDVLISATSPQCERVEIHTMSMDDRGIMSMRELNHGLPLPAREATTLTPNTGPHLMLIELHDVLKKGEQVTLTLTFQHAAPQNITAIVSARSIRKDDKK